MTPPAPGDDLSSSFQSIRIACGQPVPLADAQGNVWHADESYTGGNASVDTSPIDGTDSPAVYEGQRYGDGATSFQYSLPVPPGAYSVTLKFNEGYFTTGGRVFDVDINGEIVLKSFDIYEAAGKKLNTAVDETLAVTVGDQGKIELDFNAVIQDPRIDGIEIDAQHGESDVDAGSGDLGPVDAGTSGAPAPDGGNAARVLTYLTNLDKGTTKRVLSGQHVEIWNGDSVPQAMSNVTPLAGDTGESPAILGVVMNYVGNSGAYDISVANSIAQQWWAKGGLIEMSIYSDDPTFSSGSNGYPNGTSIPAAAFHQLTDHSTAAYAQWHKQLDTYAAELHTLTDPGNVVLLRPFIELNGNWNWYGAQDAADFIAVWKDMHDYLMKTKGLVNVLWIYNVNADVGRYADYYPGASYVDIVGMDIYAPSDSYVSAANNGGMYSFLVSTGKPLILPEFGLGNGSPGANTIDNSQLIGLIQSSLPHVVGFVSWCQGYDLTSQKGASSLLDNAWVVNLSGVPAGI